MKPRIYTNFVTRALLSVGVLSGLHLMLAQPGAPATGGIPPLASPLREQVAQEFRAAQSPVLAYPVLAYPVRASPAAALFLALEYPAAVPPQALPALPAVGAVCRPTKFHKQ